MSTLQKNQHYVWQYYLQAWTTGNKIFCYRQRDGKIIHTNTKNIGSETYFYRVHKLSDMDVHYLERLIAKAGSEELKEVHRGFIRMFQQSFRLENKLKYSRLPDDTKKQIRYDLQLAEKTMGEMYHGLVEFSATELIDRLRREDDTFYADPEKCINLFYFLSNQFFRTARTRRIITSVRHVVPDLDFRRTWQIELHIYATNLGASLIANRLKYQVLFVRNQTSIPFITGDQPVIKLLDEKASEVELYYPILPSLALILHADSKKYPDKALVVGKLQVENYNYYMYRSSEDQLYADNKEYLGTYKYMPKRDLV